MDEVDESNMSFEPMDVDLSSNSVSVMEISSSSEVSPRRSSDKYKKHGPETTKPVTKNSCDTTELSEVSPRRRSNKYQKHGPETTKPVTKNSCDTTELHKVSLRRSSDKYQKHDLETTKPVTKNSCDTTELSEVSPRRRSNKYQKHGLEILKPITERFENTEIDKPVNITVKQEKQSASGTVIKKYHIKLERQRVQKSYFSIHIVGSALIFLGVALLLFSFNNLKCSVHLDVAALKDSLSKNVFGQQFAVEDIVDALNVKTQSKILFLYGGTGVGKTFSISFILSQLLPSSNIYHYTMPTFVNSFSIELMFGLTLCKNSMIIVDDLSANDGIIIKSHVKELIGKSEDLAKNITIILIFNCDIINNDFIKKCEVTFAENLKETFSDVPAVKTFIKFNPLSQQHLRKCIEREMEHDVKETDMVRIMANFNVSLDGCKGVFHKIRFLNNI